MAQADDDNGSFDRDFLDHVAEQVIEQPDNPFHRLGSFVAAT